jgi:glutamate dehydrogenase
VALPFPPVSDPAVTNPDTDRLIQDAALRATDIASGFLAALFGRAAPEDLAHYDAETLAALAQAAFAHLGAARPQGRHDLRIYESPLDDGRGHTVIEVVNDNMPFLLDSTLAEIADQGLELRLVAHPVVAIERDGLGKLKRLVADAAHAPPTMRRESLIHIHVNRIVDSDIVDRLREGLNKAYADVRVSVEDWRSMRARVGAAIADYKLSPPPLPVDEIAEAVHFLEWLENDNFTFLGLREYRLQGTTTTEPTFNLDAVGGTGLGTLRDPNVRVLRRGRELVTVTPEVLEFLHEPHLLIIAKANVKSRVHRRVHMDYIGIKMFSHDGRLDGELRLVGLFTSSAYTSSAQNIPYIRLKVSRVLAAAHLDPSGHSGKVLMTVLESYPRDELFQVDMATLIEFSGEIARLYERPRLRVLSRTDRFDRFVSVMTFIPRDRYDTSIRQRVGDYLCRVYKGRLSAAYPYYPEGPLTRTHYIIGRDEGKTPQISRDELESAIAAIVRTWPDGLMTLLVASAGDRGRRLALQYGAAFSAAYREAFDPREAPADIAIIEKLSDSRPSTFLIYRRPGADPSRINLKVFSRGRPLPLSARVPRLEHMGFRVVSEQTFDINAVEDKPEIWLHDMALERSRGGDIDIAILGPKIEATLAAIFRGDAESDGYNALVLQAGLGWRDISILRAFSRYLRQARIGFSQDYMWETMVTHAPVALLLITLVYQRFDPRLPIAAAERTQKEGALSQQIESALSRVTSLDEDRILRRFRNLVQAAVRTNFFQLDEHGQPTTTIAFKFHSQLVDNLPLPHPLYEIAVYSPRVEGIHLRFGTVARGGIRWSDRRQDFRTEILGLVKAQQVKNAVIVPVGAKGGFFPTQLPPPVQRDAWINEGIAAYRLFVATLLNLTDNLDGGTIVPPKAVVRHDGDDPYLVVAADKGTATFSDIANSLSSEHRFWLGDAFASGGSAGYDHKKMGITARGAWEAVKRHFREMDVDIQSTPFTVAGIGDMSGDVFGNGMLLSPHIRLVAAFDHRDIFLDPNPNTCVAFQERARLFALPRSSWQDYNAMLISMGGGIFSRQAKEIILSPEIRALLGFARDKATPQEVMVAILKARVDLLWFGGIGTYVRAVAESDEAVGDRANDTIRVTGADLKCKVIGEGANLGMTQLGRIEAALLGIRLNTDAIDNSAGVNTSDLEVNIKIALSGPVRSDALDLPGRNALLASMTDEVAALVLRNNYMQTLALSLSQRLGVSDMGFQRRFMHGLEVAARLDRSVENLPDDAALRARERAGQSLTRPELAVLLAYSKLALHGELLGSNVPDEPYFRKELFGYFPQALTARFPDSIRNHRLRREIVATSLANAVINRGGPTLIRRLADETGLAAPEIVRSFAAVTDSFAIDQLTSEIDALDGHLSGQVQLDLYASVQQLLLSRLVWFLRNVDYSNGLDQVVRRFRKGVEDLLECMAAITPQTLAERQESRVGLLVAKHVPMPLASRLAALEELSAAPDIVLVTEASGGSTAGVAATFFATDAIFGLGALITAGRSVPVSDEYDRLALEGAITELEVGRRRLVTDIIAFASTGAGSGEAIVQEWIGRRGNAVTQAMKSISEAASAPLTVSRLVVAAGLISGLLHPHGLSPTSTGEPSRQ